MDYQELYNVAMGFGLRIGGWPMRTLWNAPQQAGFHSDINYPE